MTENTSLVFGEGNKYEIFGTVQHISYKEDTSLDRGHYIAYLKMKERYYKFDDSKVKVPAKLITLLSVYTVISCVNNVHKYFQCTPSGSRHALRGQSDLAFYLRRD